MKISLFSRDAGRSLFIRSQSVPQGRGTNSYGEEGRSQDSAAVASPRALAGGRRLQHCSVGFSSIQEVAPIQLVQSEKISILGNLAAEVVEKINNPTSLNAVNSQPAVDEVFHVRS
jgi:hypothetical protein